MKFVQNPAPLVFLRPSTCSAFFAVNEEHVPRSMRQLKLPLGEPEKNGADLDSTESAAEGTYELRLWAAGVSHSVGLLVTTLREQ